MSDRKPMDCGDNSCQYEGRGRDGMRTNGGCYCLKDLDFDKRMRAMGYIRHLEARVRTLEVLVSRALGLGDRGLLLNPECDWAIEASAALAGEGKP
jgi:hypothetical protein